MTAILAALWGRAKTGQGALVDVSMTHQVAGLLTSSYARVSAGERDIGGGRDVLVGRVPCYGVYPCKDGFISVGSLEPKFWHGLCASLERPDLADRGMDSDDAAADVRRILADTFRTRTRAEWATLLATHDVCVEPVRTPEEAIASGDFASVDVVVNGKNVTLPIPAIAIEGVTPSTAAAPALGEHTDAVVGTL